jgi:exodeoxyribonuclease VII large subunit
VSDPYQLEPPRYGGDGVIYTVSELNRTVRDVLEGNFADVWVEGEISNLAMPRSGHMYFSLKDARCQVRCAMFRSRNQRLSFAPADGLQVLVHAQIGLYEERGEYQLVVEQMEPAGDGRLRLAFEQLKQRLAAEGLFDPRHKKPIPELPKQLGVITSATGAAIRDILSVLKRRFPSLPIIIYPTAVQGEQAADQIVAALARANRRRECDTLILARGGGSLEDLWPFNEERVARAIFASELPIVVGVGHEIDFTIADLVADLRAPTPSASAELVSPNQRQLLDQFTAYEERLKRQMLGLLNYQRQRLTWVGKRLIHPGRRLQNLAQRLDELQTRLFGAGLQSLRTRNARLAETRARLYGLNPVHTLRAQQAERRNLQLRLRNAIRDVIKERRARLNALVATLDAVSPKATLNRGYAVVRRMADGRLVKAAKQVRAGERIEAELAEGTIEATVEKTDDSKRA